MAEEAAPGSKFNRDGGSSCVGRMGSDGELGDCVGEGGGKGLFRDERSGNIEVPLQEVRMWVLNLLTKHPRRAPQDWSSWHRKLRSGR